MNVFFPNVLVSFLYPVYTDDFMPISSASDHIVQIQDWQSKYYKMIHLNYLNLNSLRLFGVHHDIPNTPIILSCLCTLIRILNSVQTATVAVKLLKLIAY